MPPTPMTARVSVSLGGVKPGPPRTWRGTIVNERRGGGAPGELAAGHRQGWDKARLLSDRRRHYSEDAGSAGAEAPARRETTVESPDRFAAHYADLEARHLAELTFAEVRRALQALSSLYVERRERLAEGAAFDGAGKRAAFALYYGPMHFLLVREIVRALGLPARRGASWTSAAGRERRARRGRSRRAPRRGSRASTAAAGPWPRRGGPSPASASTAGRRRGDAADGALPKPPAGILAAFTVERAGRRPRAAPAPPPPRRGAGGLDRPRRRADRPAHDAPGGRSGRRRSAPPAAARTSGASAPRCPRVSPSWGRRPDSMRARSRAGRSSCLERHGA